MFCPQCDEVYPLPQGANIKLYKEIKCPLDQFELVLVSFGKKKAYPVCPYCYNNPPFENVASGMSCWDCLHPSCKFSMVNNLVAPCPDCEKGNMIFDINSKPKWRFNCNNCQFVVFFAEGAHGKKILIYFIYTIINIFIDIKLEDEKCKCGASIIHVEFNKNNAMNIGSEVITEYKGCILCDEFLNSLTHSEYVYEIELNEN